MLGVLVIHALLAPFLFGGLLFIVKNGYQAQFINQVRSHSYMFTSIAAHALGNREEMAAHMEDILLEGFVVFVQIIADDGKEKLLYETGTGRNPNFKEDFFFGQHNDSVYFISLPVYDQAGITPAHIRIGYDEAPTQEQINIAYQRGIYLISAYVVLSLALVAFSGTQVTRSLRRLRDTTRKIASGDSSKQLDILTHVSEVNSLGQDLECMRLKLVQQGELLEYQALHDALTGLPNRTLLNDRLQQALATSGRSKYSLALFMIDLDRFKEVNDTLGHHVGDQLLQKLALRLRSALRESDTVARLGGDEFAVLLPNVEDTEHAIQAAQKILRLLEKPLELEEHTLTASGSIGIAIAPEHGESKDSLMRRADAAMYCAKRTRSGYSVYHSKLDEQSASEISLINELYQAVQLNEFLLHYQPKIDLNSGVVKSVEALLRWQHPKRGMLMPVDFLRLVEKSGLINSLSLWVVKEALQQCQHWHDAGLDLPVAINLSARNLQNPDIPEQIEKILKTLNMSPKWLELEISESAVLADPLHSLDILGRLHHLGIRISLDDYGIASTSLKFLNQLPMHQIKIDSSFIARLDDPDNIRIVRSAIELAHSLGRTVIAEGVESEAVLNQLKLLGCDMAQGYHVGRPVTAGDLLTSLQGPAKALIES